MENKPSKETINYLISLREIMNRSFLILDKPSGPTSHKATQLARNLLRIGKAGHGGTLDPKVTGVLILGLGKTARLLRFLPSNKKYRGVMHLHVDVPLEDIKKIIKEKYIGKIKQRPPKRSQVKRVERIREIYSFKILGKKEKNVEFEVHCEKGTYIRKLIHDLGADLYGAHMSKLRRIAHGNFTEKDAITLERLKEIIEKRLLDKFLIPIESALNFLPKIEIKEEFLSKILNGSPVFKNYISKVGGEKNFFTLSHNKKLIGVYRKEKDKFMPEMVLKD